MFFYPIFLGFVDSILCFDYFIRIYLLNSISYLFWISIHFFLQISAYCTFNQYFILVLKYKYKQIFIVLCCFILLFVISLRSNFKVSYLETLRHKAFRMSSFALSISKFSTDSKYMSVVFSEVCPMPALMTDNGTLWLRATVAQLCLAV